MRCLRTSSQSTPLALTVGTFDGVHRGHQHVLGKLAKIARARNLPWAVVTFEPHPREYFNGHQPRLTTLYEKLMLFKQFGVPKVWVLPFRPTLASMSAESFMQDILLNKLHMAHILVGDDFRFGAGRRGDIALLQKWGTQKNFSVDIVDSYGDADLFDEQDFIRGLTNAGNKSALPGAGVKEARLASSAIRKALAEGRLSDAHRWLGRPYSISGQIIHGQHLGAALGFPTANISLGSRLPPLMGVYIVQVRRGDDRQLLPAVASLGHRPTLQKFTPPSAALPLMLETHLLNFSDNLYHQQITVEFLHKIRDEEKFSNLAELKQAIHLDCQMALEYFAAAEAS